MKTEDIAAIVALFGLILAGIFAVKGWLTNVPDSARRYGWRVATFVALIVVILNWIAVDRHVWWKVALNFVTGLVLLECTGRNWRLMEASRRTERAYAWLRENR